MNEEVQLSNNEGGTTSIVVLYDERIRRDHLKQKILNRNEDLDIFVVLCRVQQPGSYCDG